jgi:hypothetical protein
MAEQEPAALRDQVAFMEKSIAEAQGPVPWQPA